MGLQQLVRQLPPDGDWVIVQTDFVNAFNLLERQAILLVTADIFPSSYPCVKRNYYQRGGGGGGRGGGVPQRGR